MKATEWDERVVYRVTELFFAKGVDGKRPTASQIEAVVKNEFPQYDFTRESVYPHVARAVELGLIRFVPPLESTLAQQLAARYGIAAGSVCVVNTPSRKHGSLVADHAAGMALELIRNRARAHPGVPVGLGLGPGHAALNFSERLAELLRTDPTAPRISLYAISGGGPAKLPDFAPASFFTLFPRSSIDERIGMFTESLVPANQFDVIKTRPGVKEAFEARRQGKIQIVVTSMGDFEDQHDLTRQYLIDAGLKEDRLQKLGWVGNVQYRPYTAQGPATEAGDQLRPATLFELSDLVELARQKDRHVILIARQCGICGAPRHRALRPLLENPALRVFSELVTDVATARALLTS